ncbi:MAG: zf-HC2 domain-containing protein [Armatimonadota bacterium]
MATRCTSIRNQFPAYQDGELDARRQALVREHLAACPACRCEFDRLRQTACALRAWETPAVDPGLSSALMERLAAREARRLPWWHILATGWGRVAVPVGAFAVLAVAVLIVFGFPGARRSNDRVDHALPPDRTPVVDHRIDAKAKGDSTEKTLEIGSSKAVDRVEVGKRISGNGKPGAPPAPAPDPATVAVALLTETPIPEAAVVIPIASKSPEEVAIECLMEIQ